MRKIVLALLFILTPSFSSASIAGDFTINPQSTYAVPPGTADLLILDLTLPDTGLTSIKINNAGTIQQNEILQISVYEDGFSPGWDGDETERIRKSSSPFFDEKLPGDFSKQRIFITVNVASAAESGRTIRPELELNSAVFLNKDFNGPTDKKITGFQRLIAGVSMPSVPSSPLVQKGEAISTSSIRWYFMDLSNNELGFKVLDVNSKIVATGGENISYLDEIGLEPNTEYSNRKIAAFNDRGQSSASVISVFSAVKTLLLPKIEEAKPPEEVSPLVPEVPVTQLSGAEQLKLQIQEIQQKIIDLLQQLIQILQEQASKAQASLFGAFGSITDWLESLSR